MSSVQDSVETHRLVLEVTQAEKELIKRAAERCGCSLNEFAVGWLRDAAMEVLETRPAMRLTAEDMIAVLDAAENPSPPNDALRQAFRDYRELVNDRTK